MRHCDGIAPGRVLPDEFGAAAQNPLYGLAGDLCVPTSGPHRYEMSHPPGTIGPSPNYLPPNEDKPVAQIKQVHTHHVERHANRTITQRLGCAPPEAVISVIRDHAVTGTVILHVNSGGNALASELQLRSLGYRVEPTNYAPFTPGHYGVQLRVGPAA